MYLKKGVKGNPALLPRIQFCGTFPNPEELAYNRPGLPAQPLYRVRFVQAAVWPDYDGAADDTIDIELYQHWLEPG